MLLLKCILGWCRSRVLDLGRLVLVSSEESSSYVEVSGLLRCSIWLLFGLGWSVGHETLKQAFVTAALWGGRRARGVNVYRLGAIIFPDGCSIGIHLGRTRQLGGDCSVIGALGTLDSTLCVPWVC